MFRGVEHLGHPAPGCSSGGADADGWQVQDAAGRGWGLGKRGKINPCQPLVGAWVGLMVWCRRSSGG